jgi:hypothetical protein
VPDPPTWPTDPNDYVPGPISYINSLTVPAVVSGVPTCCKDFGTISKDYIVSGTNNMDNALAVLAGSLGAFGVDLQQLLTDAITGGSLVVLLDHQDLAYSSLPDPYFALVQLLGEFDVGTTFVEANAGTGEFLIDPASFLPASGEPVNWYFPADMQATTMSAGPFTLSLSLPLGFVTLDVQAFGAEVDGVHGAITAAGVPYTSGTLAGYILVDDIFAVINALIDSPQCDCLGLSSSVYTEQPNGTWTGSCVTTAGLCTLPDEEICKTLAGNSLFASPPEVCLVLPSVLQSQADIDLNSNSTVYEGLSLGLQLTGATGTITGIAP